jgi:hypothetical protein
MLIDKWVVMLWSRLRAGKIDEAGFESEKAEIVLSRDGQRWTSNVSRGGSFVWRSCKWKF